MAAIRMVRASSLYVSEPVDWLTSRVHFSFAEHYDPDRSNFGVLRVLNDDLVKVRTTLASCARRRHARSDNYPPALPRPPPFFPGRSLHTAQQRV